MASTTRVEISKEAKRFLDRTPQKERFNEALISLQDGPFPHGFEKVQGYIDCYRVRVGGYRIIYTFEPAKRLITVLYIRRRESAY